ncbi:MAG TPA: DNA alkylation repair protein [Candidatus Eisenbacteria bacterium]|nr:DNA alkylation repair protein [Candidatus Eisenbacteria bacterium]
MKLPQILATLETMGLAENRALYARHGIPAPSYGVAFRHLRDLAKQVGASAATSDALWATGNHDARILATLVAGERGATPARLRRWAATLDNYVIADLLARWAAHAKSAPALAAEWIASPGEWTARAGWMLRALLAIDRPELPDREFAASLDTIEREIHRAPNRVRDAMNMALIAIAIGREALTERAIEAARRIGPVEVDFGESGGALAPAEETIRRGVEQRQRQASGRAGGRKAATRKRATAETKARPAAAPKKRGT